MALTRQLLNFGRGTDGLGIISTNTTFAEANAGCSGTAGSLTLTLDAASTFANGDMILIHQSRGTSISDPNWEINYILSGGGGTTLTLLKPLTRAYTDSGADQAQVVKIKEYSAITVNSGSTWTGSAWDGNKGGIFVVACNGVTRIEGTISAVGKGFIGGNGGAVADQAGTQGEGTTGAGTLGVETANGNAGGGTKFTSTQDGGSGGGGGAGGFDGGSGGLGQQGLAGVGGVASGNAALTTANFGGSGGGGSAGRNGSNNGGEGGNGGGIIILLSKIIIVTGSIAATGGVGVSATNNSGGGGGGGGGSIILKGQTFVIGSGLVTAAGANGGAAATAAGSGSSTTTGGNGTGGGGGGNGGGGGGAGRVHADYANSVIGTTAPALDSSSGLGTEFVRGDIGIVG